MQTIKDIGPVMPPKKTPSRPATTIWLIEDNHTFRNTVARVLNSSDDLECS